MDGTEDGGLEAREGEIKGGGAIGVFNDGMGEFVFVFVAFLGGLRDGGATWIGKTEDFGDFVKTFADGVVSRGADDLEIGVAGHID